MSLEVLGGMAMAEAYTVRKFHRENMKSLSANASTSAGAIEENGGRSGRWFLGKLITKKNSAKFGKGIYFADLVSKSAQYCFTSKKDPVGLMLLSEVALGEIHELTKAKYMDKPPKGKHSTKGLGKKVPQDSEFAKWRDDVTVPCGKPVSSEVKASELMYNEYIVYNTAQMKLQFLLKVRFKHKR